jgi:hypothetical protein
VRESNIGNELKEVAHDVMRFGERCVQAGRNWLNERRDDMSNRNNEGRGDLGSGPYGQGRGQRGPGQRHEHEMQSEQQFSRGGPRGPQINRNRGEYYGGAQFNERAQSAGWDEDSNSDWSYEGGPERFGSSGYSEGNLRASGAYQGGSRSSRQGVDQYGGQAYGQSNYSREYGVQDYGMQREQYGRERSGLGGDYYSGRQGFGAQGAYGSDYNTYGRNQGYGEGSGYTRQQNLGPRGQFAGSLRNQQGLGSAYGGESSGTGGRGPLYAGQDYLDEGEMSGYRGRRELGTQEIGSRSSGRYGTEPGQYGYGGYGLGSRGYRGIGPKNYTRSDERLTEEINERLTDDDDLDASDITVRVQDCKVTLEGTVDQRWMKHRAEDIADACSGVKEVDNRIQVSASSRDLGGQDLGARGASRSTGSRTTTTGTGTTGTAGTTDKSDKSSGTPH